MNELSETRLSHSSIGGSARLHVNEEHSEGEARANNAAVPSHRPPAGVGILFSVMGTKGQKGPGTPTPRRRRWYWLLSPSGHTNQNGYLFRNLKLQLIS